MKTVYSAIYMKYIYAIASALISHDLRGSDVLFPNDSGEDLSIIVYCWPTTNLYHIPPN